MRHVAREWIRWMGLGVLLATLPALSAGCRTARPPADTAEATGTPDAAATNTPVAASAAATNAPGPLAVESAISLAIAQSADIQVLRATLEVARQTLRAAGDRDNPELRLSYGDQDATLDRNRWSYDQAAVPGAGVPAPGAPTPPPDSTGLGAAHATQQSELDAYRVGVRFFPRNPWTTRARVSACAAAHYAAVEDLRAAEAELAVEVRKLFAAVRYLEEDLLAAGELVRLRAQVREIVARRAREGVVTVQDLADAARQHLAAVTAQNKTRRDLKQARCALAALVGMPEAALAVTGAAAGGPAVAAAPSDVTALSARALRQRADLSALAWRTREAEAASRETSAARLPWLKHVQVSYGDASERSRTDSAGYSGDLVDGGTRNEYDFTRDRDRSEEWTVDAAVIVPVFDWLRLNHAADESRALHRLAQVRELEAGRAIAAAVRSRVDDLAAVLADRDACERDTAPLVTEVERLLEQAAQHPEVIEPDRVARMQEELVQTRRLRLQADHFYRLALIELEAAVGGSLAD